MKKENIFVKNTAILMLSSVMVKVLSAVYRIIATRTAGATGMGQYTAVFSLFMPFYAFATSGITPTVSGITASVNSDDKREIASVRKTVTRYFIALTTLMIAMAVLTAYIYGNYSDNRYMLPGVVILCFNMMFATSEAVYKGISQGTMRMQVTAKANIIESTAKIVILFLLVYILPQIVNTDENYRIICLFFTVSLAGLVCIIYMHTDFHSYYNVSSAIKKDITPHKVFAMALPISLSALIVTVSNFFDTTVCLPIIKAMPDRVLMSSYSFVSFTSEKDKAMWLYGVYQGLCMSVAGIIPSFSASIGASSLPLITRSIAEGNTAQTQRLTNKLIKFTSAIVIPVSLFVAFFSYEIIGILYGQRGAQSTLGGYFLRLMAPAAILSAFTFPFNSILHAYNRSKTILHILTAAVIIKMPVSFFLCSVEKINVMGLMYSHIIFDSIVFMLSILAVKKSDNKIKVLKHIVIPALLSYILLTALTGIFKYQMYNTPLLKIACVAVSFIILYTAGLFMTGFFVEDMHE